MDGNLSTYLGQIKVNNFFAKCVRVSNANSVVEFKMNFNSKPLTFVTVNRFIIKYDDKEGSLIKKNASFKVDAEKIKFDTGNFEQGSSIPVCILSIE